MNKTIIGLLFITAGAMYGSLALDGIYDATLGYLLERSWINPPAKEKVGKFLLGRKPTILLYSLTLILIGLYILWNREI